MVHKTENWHKNAYLTPKNMLAEICEMWISSFYVRGSKAHGKNNTKGSHTHKNFLVWWNENESCNVYEWSFCFPTVAPVPTFQPQMDGFILLQKCLTSYLRLKNESKKETFLAFGLTIPAV